MPADSNVFSPHDKEHVWAYNKRLLAIFSAVWPAVDSEPGATAINIDATFANESLSGSNDFATVIRSSDLAAGHP